MSRRPHCLFLAFLWMMSFACGSFSSALAQVQWSGNGHYYRAVSTSEPLTWNQAHAAVQATGGYLATLTTAEENAFVFSLIDAAEFWHFDANPLGPYLGGVQLPGSSEPGGGWQWLTGEAWIYTNWSATEPSNGVGSPHGIAEDKLQFFADGVARSARWNDIPSDYLGAKGYVIEFDGDPATFVTVSGTIDLQGTQNASHTLTFVFRPASSYTLTRTVVLDASGAYSIANIPRGVYTVSIKGTKWLRKNITVDTQLGNVTDANVLLLAGDANNDNFVDISDLLLLIEHYNQTSPNAGFLDAADFNGDGANDITDLLLLIGNYNQQGDSLP
jgi:hypothetical protein